MRKIVALGLVVLIGVIVFFWWRNGSAPVNASDEAKKVFVVERGAGIRQIANELKKEGLIRDPIVFFLYVKKTGKDTSIQAGDYKLSPSMNLAKVVDELLVGRLDIWVTVQEGRRAEEVADILKQDIPSYEESWRAELIENEGYLFPDTYLIPRDADIDMVLSIFKTNFENKVAEAGLSTHPNLSRLVTIASMIEREAFSDAEKPMIASVINNRLTDGISLDIDATLQYAKGKVNGKWWSVPTGADRKIDSPYNTYLYPDIPPGPISNPGIEAIKAAANPASSDYYFYIHDTTGKVHFAKTLEEHQRNINRYL